MRIKNVNSTGYKQTYESSNINEFTHNLSDMTVRIYGNDKIDSVSIFRYKASDIGELSSTVIHLDSLERLTNLVSKQLNIK